MYSRLSRQESFLKQCTANIRQNHTKHTLVIVNKTGTKELAAMNIKLFENLTTTVNCPKEF